MCMSSSNGVEQVRFNGLYQSLRAMTFIEGSLACFAINPVDAFTFPFFYRRLNQVSGKTPFALVFSLLISPSHCVQISMNP